MIHRDCFVRLSLLTFGKSSSVGPFECIAGPGLESTRRTSTVLIPHTVELDQNQSSVKALQPQGTAGPRAVPLVGSPGKVAGSIPRRGDGPYRADRSGAAGEQAFDGAGEIRFFVGCFVEAGAHYVEDGHSSEGGIRLFRAADRKPDDAVQDLRISPVGLLKVLFFALADPARGVAVA